MIAPRVAWYPPRARSLGPECVAFWRAAGGELFEWQELVIDGLLGVGEDGRFVSSDDGLCVARQNGKGVIEQAIEVYFAFELGYRVVMHTAHEFATSQEHQLRLEEFIQNAPDLHARVKDKGGYVHANGQESIRLRNGVRIVFKARTKGGGRGYSGDLLVWDEAMVLPVAVVGAQKPMLRASKAPFGQKTIYGGSAVDKELHEHGVPFALIRERGIENAKSVAYFEWSAPFDDVADVTKEVLRDRAHWPVANPSMPEGLIAEEYMAGEIEAMPARVCAVELYNVGDWPETDPEADSMIQREKWTALEDEESDPLPDVVYAFDVTPNRGKATIGCAAFRRDGLAHVDVVENRTGTGWVVEKFVDLVARHKPVAVVCDSVGPAASLIPELEQAGVRVTVVNTAELGRYCGLFFDAVEQETVRHLGQQSLDDAVKGADTRTIGDAGWAWSRKHSKVDISPLVTVTLAHGHLTTRPVAKMVVAFA